MPAWGQKRPNGDVRAESAVPRTADIGGRGWQVSCVPQPDSCTAAKNNDHSITSSARASTVAGMSRPSALAVLRLITSSYLVGACTGRSAGYSQVIGLNE